jgi:hypothetical protein
MRTSAHAMRILFRRTVMGAPDLKPQTVKLETKDDIVLQYLGAALVLQWPQLPEAVQKSILLQASSVGGLRPVPDLQQQMDALIARTGPSPMATGAHEIYASSNGDRWWLVRDERANLCVRHEANAASGGYVSTVDVATFLASGGLGPEKQALMRLIGEGLESGRA